jgi:chloride channel protein, CIC family
MPQFSTPKMPTVATKQATQMARFLFLCVIVGVVAGFGATAFYGLLEGARYLFQDLLAGFHPPGPLGEGPLIAHTDTPFRPWVFFLLPALGGLVCGVIVYRFAPETAGHGTDAAIEAYHFHNGKVRARVPLVKAISAAITLGTGGSAGREGPIAQIGSGFASVLSKTLGLKSHERRTLMAAGMAAGIGAIFHAPLAGALFAAEVLYKDMDLEHEVLVPAFISSITAYSIFCMFFGWHPVFVTPEFVFHDPLQLLPYTVLAVVLAGCALGYTRLFYLVHHAFSAWNIPNYVKPAIGGLLAGTIGLFAPRALGAGYGIVQQAINHELSVWVLLGLAFAKMLTTSFSVGSGGSGGVFGPSIVIGGALGGAVGLLAEQLFPGQDIHAGAFVVVGMAGFFAAAANCPISTIIMVSEMTGNFHLLVPSMLVCIVAYLLARRLSLYEKQLPSRLEAPSKMGNMLSAVLRKISIEKALGLPSKGECPTLLTVKQNMPLAYLIDHFSKSGQPCFPVVDEDGKLCGVITSEDIRPTVTDSGLLGLILAHDIAKPAETVVANDTLLTAITKMNATESQALVVVNSDDSAEPVAVLSHDRVIQAYSQEIFDEAS